MNKIMIFSFLCSTISLFYASEHQSSKKIGIFSDINKRKFQEDFFYHGIVDGGNLYAVYDGHFCHRVGYTENDDNNGCAIAKFLAEKFSIYFKKASGSTIKERMMAAFKNADNDEFVKENKDCGSTAAIVFIKDNVAHCAYVGDSRALLERNGKINFVTQDHIPNKLDESLRIIKAGGVIFERRVNGFLSITRAFGDYILDKKLIIADPDYEEIPLTTEHKFLVLASNGLWNMVSNEEVVGILNAKKSIQDMNLLAKMLAIFAVHRGSRDNITVMLVDLLS